MNHFSLSHSLLFRSEMLRDCPVKRPLNLLVSFGLTAPPFGPADSGHGGGWRDSECGPKVLGADVPSGPLFSCQSHGLPPRMDFCAVLYAQDHTKLSLSLSL